MEMVDYLNSPRGNKRITVHHCTVWIVLQQMNNRTRILGAVSGDVAHWQSEQYIYILPVHQIYRVLLCALQSNPVFYLIVLCFQKAGLVLPTDHVSQHWSSRLLIPLAVIVANAETLVNPTTGHGNRDNRCDPPWPNPEYNAGDRNVDTGLSQCMP